jgi:hypothetical protein
MKAMYCSGGDAVIRFGACCRVAAATHGEILVGQAQLGPRVPTDVHGQDCPLGELLDSL